MVRFMLSRMLVRRIKCNKKRFALTVIVILFITFAANHIALRMTAEVNTVNKLVASKANVAAIVDSRGVSLKELCRMGVVYAYVKFHYGEISFRGKNYSVLIGEGYIKTINVSTPEHGVVILGLPSIHAGSRVKVSGREEVVVASYYYPLYKPIVLLKGASGDKLYILMKTENTAELARYLENNTRIYWFRVYGKGWFPYKDVIEGLGRFLETILMLTMIGLILLVTASSIACTRAIYNDLVALKYIGLPSHALALLAFGEYTLAGVIGYVIGVPLGLYTAYARSVGELIPPAAIQFSSTITVNLVLLTAILAPSLLSTIYVSRLNPIENISRKAVRRRRIILVAMCFIVGLSVGIPLSTVILSYTPVELIPNIPCKYIIYGPVSELNITGDYGGYLSGQEASNGVVNVTVSVYMFPVNSSIAPLIVSEGRWIHGGDEAVIGRGLALKLGVGVGDTIHVRVLSSWRDYRVVGISNLTLDNGEFLVIKPIPGVACKVLFTNSKLPVNSVEELEEKGFIVLSSSTFKSSVKSNLMIYTIGTAVLVVMLSIASAASLTSLAGSEVVRDAKVIAALKALGIPDKYYVTRVCREVIMPFMAGFALSIPIAARLAQHLLLMTIPLPVSMQALAEGVEYLMAVAVAVTVLTILFIYRLVRSVDAVRELRL